MRRKLKFRLVLALVLWAIVIAECFGQGQSTAMDIIRSVQRLQVPTKGYKMNVVQTVASLPATSTAPSAAFVQRSIPVDSGTAVFEPSGGLKRVRVDKTNENSALRVPKLMVDLSTVLKELMTYAFVTVDSVALDNRPQFLLGGENAQKSKKIIIWVDRENNRVSRVEVGLMGKQFAEIDFTYENKINGYWLPATIKVHHFTDDSRVVLDFSGYAFSN